MPMRMIQCARLSIGMCVGNIFDVRIASVCLKYLSAIATTYWFPFAIFDDGPRISMETKSSSSLAQKR